MSRESEKRRRHRRRLNAEGLIDEVVVERIVQTEQLRRDGMPLRDITDRVVNDAVFRQLARRHDPDTARRLVFPDDGYTSPDDSRHRPRHVPAELRGVARATGQTATAVRTGRTINHHEHTERETRR